MNQKGFAILPLIIVVLVAGIGYWVWQNKLDKPGKETLTYHNEKYGFKIEIPDTWKDYRVKEGLLGSGANGGTAAYVVEFIFTDEGSPNPDYAVAYLGIYDSKTWEKLASKGDLIAENRGYFYTYTHPQAAPFSKELLDRVNESRAVLSGIKFDK